MNGLALCAGVGMLDEGLRAGFEFLGFDYRTVCYVEREAYAAGILAARMADGALDHAPIWDDIATFDGAAWRGKVDCITAGFPCPPFSMAGKRQGADDDRWLWPDIVRIIRAVEPKIVLLENVPGLLNGPGERNLCVCGGADRRGRVNLHSEKRNERDATVCAVFGDRNGSSEISQRTEFDSNCIRRNRNSKPKCQERECHHLHMENPRSACGVCAETNSSSLVCKTETGAISNNSFEPRQKYSSDGKREAPMVREPPDDVAGSLCEIAGTELAWRQSNETGALCNTCGRPVYDTKTRGSIRTSALGDVLWSLSALGFDAEWGVLSAGSVRASQKRERIFILAYSRLQFGQLQQRQIWTEHPGSGGAMDDTARDERNRQIGESWRRRGICETSNTMADAHIPGLQRRRNDAGKHADQQIVGPRSLGIFDMANTDGGGRWVKGNSGVAHWADPCCSEMDGELFAPGPNDQRWADIISQHPYLAPATQSGVYGMVNGLAVVVGESRTDQLRAIGNGVVPLQAATAFVLLARRAGIFES